ncbi:hypothetical protein [Okeania sp. SIO1I7]|uniref:hypothetical protein n=1 Tax=Okeania sp. SIO1I7 TaxID=2607772 RepID=UPI0013F836B3|nr:hypothetical protein [Okeania sp. SIO1I7]NET28851.1 hypothetical protein [Okeania sp. SIO1I7]
MEILRQTLKLEHELNDGDVLISEVEFDFEDGDNHAEVLEKVRAMLVDNISNGRPDIADKCRHSMGMEYSLQQLDHDKACYRQLCNDIEKLKTEIRIKQEDLAFLLSTNDRLKKIDKVIKDFNYYSTETSTPGSCGKG